MQPPDVIVDYWLDLRQRLLAHGFVQTTLTYFEREDIHQTDRRFIYEEAGFNPEVYDALGFGPPAPVAIGAGEARATSIPRPDPCRDKERATKPAGK